MPKLRIIALAALLGGFLSTAGADTLDVGRTIDTDESWPSRGMTKSRVEAKYGSPNSKTAAVGDPPISSWDYGEYIVYFEYDHVIQSVRKR